MDDFFGIAHHYTGDPVGLLYGLYAAIPPVFITIAQALMTGVGAFFLLTAFVPRTYGRGPYRYTQFVHWYRLAKGAIWVALGTGMQVLHPGSFYAF